MFLNRYAPAAANQLRREMADLFDTVFQGLPFETASARAFPALNIWEDAESLHAEAELPGLALEDVEIFVVGNELTIKGRRKPAAGEKLTYYRQERGVGEFARSITLPYEINAEKVEATLKNGVLNLILPKAETARPRKINVKAS